MNSSYIPEVSSWAALQTETIYYISRSSIIGTLINVILAIPGLMKNSKQFDYRDFFTNKSLQYRDPDNRELGFFFDYREIFLDLIIPIIVV